MSTHDTLTYRTPHKAGRQAGRQAGKQNIYTNKIYTQTADSK